MTVSKKIGQSPLVIGLSVIPHSVGFEVLLSGAIEASW